MLKKLFSFSLVFALCFSMIACSVDQVLADINVILQMVNALAPAVALVSPPDAAAVGVLVSVGSEGINVIKADYDQWKASGATTDLQKLQAAIATFNSNLAAEMKAAHISSPAAVQTVTKWDAVLTSTTEAILALLPQVTSATDAKAAKLAAASPVALTPEGLQARWVAEVCQGDKKCSSLVVYHKHGKLAHYASLGNLK
jgi:hypothetical protein